MTILLAKIIPHLLDFKMTKLWGYNLQKQIAQTRKEFPRMHSHGSECSLQVADVSDS